MVKMIKPRARLPRRLAALALPALALAPAVPAGAAPGCAQTAVCDIGGVLHFSEAGSWVPVPEGAAVPGLRALLRTGGDEGRLTVEVGRTVVADGGSGWHGTDKKP